jgi:hypothetical protein
MPIWKSVLSHVAIGGLAVGLALPAFAAPLPLSQLAPMRAQTQTEVPANVLTVDHRRGHNPHRGYNNQNGRHYYNGHRGYRKYRQGYRRYNGWWFPPAAFGFGIGVAPGPRYVAPPRYAAPPRYGRGYSPAHYQWCDQRYRSYRAVDNSFQPYHGPRRACVSPYGP